MSGDGGGPVVWAVRQLPGVSSAEADVGPAGDVSALRVRITPGADRAAVEAAVRRVADAHFGCGQSADRVRILGDPEVASRRSRVGESPPAAPAPRRGRMRILRTDVVFAGAEVTATVVLAAGPHTATGSSSGGIAGGGAHRAVATAALRALEGLLAPGVRLELEQVQTQQGQDPVVLVRLSLVSADGAQRLTGAALVRHDECDAVVRAALDAANRRVEALLG